MFAPVARFALAAQSNWELHHLDVELAFVNGEIKKEIVVAQLVRFVKEEERRSCYAIEESLIWLETSS